MLFVEGVAHRLEGRPDEADTVLAHALDVAIAFDARPAGRADPRRARRASRRTAASGRRPPARPTRRWRSWATAPTTSTGAARSCSRGRLAWRRTAATCRTARDLLTRATRLRPLLSYALPVTSVRTLVEMARAYVAIGELADAGAVVRQAREIVRQRPDLGLLATEVDAMQTLPGGGTSLSAAELRIVPAAGEPPDPAGDRRPALPLAPHREDALDRRLPEARRVLAPRGDRRDCRRWACS